MKAREFQIGETLWLASFEREQTREPCPVCFGKKVVLLTLGDGSVVETRCDYCRDIMEGSKGFEDVWTQKPRVKLVTVAVRRIEEYQGGKREIEYLTEGGMVLDRKRLFETEAAAMACAEDLAAEQDNRDRDQRKRDRTNALNKVSWSVGYHKAKAAEARKVMEQHERWAHEVQAAKEAHDAKRG